MNEELQAKINAMSIEEIEQRRSAIADELKTDGVDIDALEVEVDALNERAKSIKQEEEKRKALLEQVANHELGEESKRMNPEVNKENVLASMEYRSAFKAYAQKGVQNEILKRTADVNISTDLGVLLPETVVQKVITELDGVYGTLWSKVRHTNIKGGVKYPIGSFGATFKRITETSVSERQKGGSITGSVVFSYNIGEIRLARTLLEDVLSVEAFETELAKVIVKAYVKAMDLEIINGDPEQNEMEGILKSDRVTNVIEMTADDVADWTKWEEKVFAEIPLALENAGLEFVVAKQTYVSNLCTLKDDNNQPIHKAGFDVTDKQHKFNEYPVTRVEKTIFNDFNSCSTGDVFGMLWAPKEAYAVNSNMQFTMMHYFDQETNQYVDKALCINDGKVLDPQYIYLLKKK